MARQTFELRRTYTYDYSILSPDDQVENFISFCKDIGSASKEAKDILGRVHSYETDDSDVPSSDVEHDSDTE